MFKRDMQALMTMNKQTTAILRIPAMLIDFIIIGLFIAASNKLAISTGVIQDVLSIELLMFVCVPFAFFLYWVGGIHIGKRLFRLQIVDAVTKKKPTLFQYFRRCLLFSLVISLNLLFLIPLFVSKKNQALHDKLAGTIVIKKGSV